MAQGLNLPWRFPETMWVVKGKSLIPPKTATFHDLKEKVFLLPAGDQALARR